MKRKYLIAMGICAVFIWIQAAQACWLYVTIDELIQSADVILVGEVIGRTGQTIQEKSIDYNKWRVKAHYYVKGAIDVPEILVGTPNQGSSLHYDLNEQGDQVLLFLQKSRDYYLPYSPQAIVGVEFLEKKIKEEEREISGQELLKRVEILGKNMNVEEKEKLQDYLCSQQFIKVMDKTIEGKNELGALSLASLSIIGIGSILFLWRRKK